MDSLRSRLNSIIFDTDTPAGRIFDIALLWAILVSILVVVLESLRPLRESYGYWFFISEWVFTGIFTLEYAVRIWVAKSSKKYLFSPLGIIDLLAILPAYLGLLFASGHYLLVIRALRLLRVFRIFKLNRFVNHGNLIILSLRRSMTKISVFMFSILNLVLIIGTLMYVIEGEANGFDNIPRSVYWAIVTITTVGYGDIAPQTPLGQLISSLIMIVGYAIIAVPTGIITAEITKEHTERKYARYCPHCKTAISPADATFCPYCGAALKSSHKQ